MKKFCVYMKKIAETIQKTALYGGIQKEEYQSILPDILQKKPRFTADIRRNVHGDVSGTSD